MKEDKLDKVVSAVVKAIDKRMNKKPKSYYTQAEVLRVDKQDKTAYVHIPGGVDQTPATLTIDAKVGDTVEVRVGEGRAFIVGNETNPPSDNETAEEAKETASSALSHSLESVVDDKLFYLASAQDTGVTVEDEGWTEEPQEPTALLPYLWVYHKYTRGSGSTFNSDPMIIAVYTEDGVSVTGVQPQYYLSTSSSSAVGGTWSNSLTYLSGYYIWTRNAISYSDGTTGYSTAIYDQALTEACSLSYNSAQYFWTKSSSNYTSCPTGSYVTEVSRDYYDPDKGGTPSGGSVLIRSAGVFLRYAAKTLVELVSAGLKIYEPNDSTNPVAQFLSSGIILGTESGSHVLINSGEIGCYTNSSTKPAAVKFKVVSGLYSAELNSTYTSTNKTGVVASSGPVSADNVVQLIVTSGGVGNTAVLYKDYLETEKGLNVGGALTAGNIDSGTATLDEVTAGSYGNTSVSFNKTFSSAPNVVVTIKTTINNADVGNVTVSVYSVSTTGFTARVHNASTHDRTPQINWIAIG